MNVKKWSARKQSVHHAKGLWGEGQGEHGPSAVATFVALDSSLVGTTSIAVGKTVAIVHSCHCSKQHEGKRESGSKGGE